MSIAIVTKVIRAPYNCALSTTRAAASARKSVRTFRRRSVSRAHGGWLVAGVFRTRRGMGRTESRLLAAEGRRLAIGGGRIAH